MVTTSRPCALSSDGRCRLIAGTHVNATHIVTMPRLIAAYRMKPAALNSRRVSSYRTSSTPECGPKSETTVTPTSTRPMCPASVSVIVSLGPRQPVLAMVSEKTIVRPAKGAIIEMGSSEKVIMSTTAEFPSRISVPIQKRGRQMHLRCCSVSELCLMNAIPSAEFQQP